MSERKFNVGDRVRIIDSKFPERIGVITTVVSELTTFCSCGATDPSWTHGHHLDLPNLHPGHEGCTAWIGPQYLEPYYDGNEKVSWSSCEWQPKKARA